jgi:hypothetical protein
MSYIPEYPDNVMQHDEYHDHVVNGYQSLSGGDIIWDNSDLRITHVQIQSPKEPRKCAEDVFKEALKDAEFDPSVLFDNEFDVQVFLLHKANRIIGFLGIDRRDHIWITSWQEREAQIQPKRIDGHTPMWSVFLIWILKRHRRSYYAKTLLETSLSFLGLNIDAVGWYEPFSDSGAAFVKKCCPDKYFIAK